MLKKIGLMVGVLVAILIIAAIAVPYFVPDSAFKVPILNKIRAMTGRQVTVGGKFSLRFFPVAGVTMEDITLSGPPGTGETSPLMTLKSLNVEIGVIPLFDGNIQIKKLVLNEPHLYLRVAADGSKNWLPPKSAQPVLPHTEAGSESKPVSPESSMSTSLPMLRNLMLGDVKLEDGTVSYNDASAKTQWEIKKLNGSLSANSIDSPFTVDGNGEWKDKEVKVKGALGTLKGLFNHSQTPLKADIESELLSFSLDGAIENEVYKGKATVKSPSVKALAAWADPEGKSLATPAKLALDMNADAECSETSCNLTNASLTLDNIAAKGSLKADWQNKPQVAADLTTGVLDFNPFLSAAAVHSSGLIIGDAYAETDGRWSDSLMDFSGLKAVNGTANIVADGVVINKVTLGKTTLHAKLENEKLGIDIVDAVMYGGKGNITVNVDGAASPPTLEKRASLKGVQVAPLFRDAMGTSKLSGAADIEMNVTSHGRSERELVSNAAGSGQFKLTDGAIEGVDLVNIIANKSGGGTKTPIENMSGSFTIAAGVVNNHDLVMTLPTLHVGGAGDINLPAFTINYRLTPQTVTAPQGQGAAAKQGVSLPVIIEGSLDKPTFRPDLNALAQQALKDPKAFKDQLKNTRDTLKGTLNSPDGVNNLKNLLKGF